MEFRPFCGVCRRIREARRPVDSDLSSTSSSASKVNIDGNRRTAPSPNISNPDEVKDKILYQNPRRRFFEDPTPSNFQLLCSSFRRIAEEGAPRKGPPCLGRTENSMNPWTFGRDEFNFIKGVPYLLLWAALEAAVLLAVVGMVLQFLLRIVAPGLV